MAAFPDAFVVDVVIAYAIAVLWNYLGARLVFRPETPLAAHGWRYASVVALNFAATATVAWACRRAELPDAVAVYLPVALTVVPTYVFMRVWVFCPPLR